MKVTVKIDGRPYVVEVGDINARPIIATVDDERYEVWPEDEQIPAEAEPTQIQARPSLNRTDQPAGPDSNHITAPIPGEILSIAVQPGDQVSVGDEICVLEAMKMKNAIRSPRAGKIAAVKVTAGQQVVHGDVLIEFEKS